MRHAMLNMTDENRKKPGKCTISRCDACEGMYKTCGVAIGADTWFIHVVLKHWGKHCSTVHVSTVCCIFIIKSVFSDGSATASGCLP